MGVNANGDEAAPWSADLAEVLLTEAQIQERVTELARQITAEYAGQQLLLVGVLKGACVFLSDLIRKIALPLEIDLICVSSYGSNAESCGSLKMLKDIAADVQGRAVLLVEDIVDSGVTLSHLVELMRQRGPQSVKVCALLSKPSRRRVDVAVDFLGFEIPDAFVVGYGLDYAERYRSLPFVAVLKPEVYR